MNPYTYRATMLHVVDGDTVDCDVALLDKTFSAPRFKWPLPAFSLDVGFRIRVRVEPVTKDPKMKGSVTGARVSVVVTDRFRLFGINAPESYGADATDAGRAAKAWLIARLPDGKSVILATEKDHTEKYGRFLARVFACTSAGDAEAVSINDEMVAAGHAKSWDGKGVRPT